MPFLVSRNTVNFHAFVGLQTAAGMFACFLAVSGELAVSFWTVVRWAD